MASPATAAAHQAGGGAGAAVRRLTEQAPAGAGPQQSAAAGIAGAAGAAGAPPAPAATPRARSSSTVQTSAIRAMRLAGSSAPRYWEMHVVMHMNDFDAGRAYHTHPDTGHTTWEIPPCTGKGFALIPLRPVVHAAAAGSYTGSEDKENVSGVDTMQQLDSGKKRGRAPDAASHTAADRLALARILPRTGLHWRGPSAMMALHRPSPSPRHDGPASSISQSRAPSISLRSR